MGYNPLVGISSTSKTTSRQTQTGYQNGSGSTITAATPVSADTSGMLQLADVTDESSIEAFVGLVLADVPSAANGQVVSDGRMENIPLGLGFSVGDALWLGNTPGTLTNVKPDLSGLGWASGYFVVFIGVVVKNEFNPSNQDIQILKQNVGQL